MNPQPKIFSLKIDFGVSPIIQKHELESITKLYKEKYPTTTADFWVLECNLDTIEKVEFNFYYDTESDLVEKTSFISSLITFQLGFVIHIQGQLFPPDYAINKDINNK